MADFSIGDALGSGYGLMRRRPLSVLAWGLAYLLIGMVLPIALVAGTLGGDFASVLANLHFPPAGQPADPAELARMMAPLHGLMLIQPIMWLTSLAAQAILTAAVFRATLEPRKRGLAYMGLGGREWWLALLSFVSRILGAILAVLLGLVGLVLGFALNAVFEAQHVEKGVRALAFAALGAALIALFVGILVRFSMAGPMTFAERQFRLFESWNMTRRHGWKLFGLGVLLVLVTAVTVMVFEAVGAAIVILISGGLHWNAAAFWAALTDQRQLWSTGLGEGLVALVLLAAYAFGGLFAISLAPWAVVYRELSSTPAPSPREGGLYFPAPLMMEPEPGLEPAPEPTPAPDPLPEAAVSEPLAEAASDLAPPAAAEPALDEHRDGGHERSEPAVDDHGAPAAEDHGADDGRHEHGHADPHANTDEGGDGHHH